MALKTVIENLARARKEYEEQLASLGEDAQKGIGEAIAEVLPEGYGLSWTQYTPYFNDGDACVFSVNDPSLVKLGKPGEDDEESEEDEDPEDGIDFYGIARYGQSDYYPAREGVTKEMLLAVQKVWDLLPEDMLEQVFGDHVRVLIRKDGSVDVSEYSHD